MSSAVRFLVLAGGLEHDQSKTAICRARGKSWLRKPLSMAGGKRV